MPPNELVVVHECDPEPSDLHLIKLAAFMGVPVRGVSLSPTADGQGREILQVMRRGGEREHLASMPQPVIVARYASKYGGRVGNEVVCSWISSWRE